MFSCKSWEIFNNAFSIKHLRPTPRFHETALPTPPMPFFDQRQNIDSRKFSIHVTHANFQPMPPTHPRDPRAHVIQQTHCNSIMFYLNVFFHLKRSVKTQNLQLRKIIKQNSIAILQWCQRFSITYFLLYIHFICHSSVLYLHEKKLYTLNDKSNQKRRARHYQINNKIII